MVGASDVQCKGATSAEGLTMKPFYLSHRKVEVTIPSSQGQSGKVIFLSGQRGSVDGSLAATENRDANCIFFVENY